MSIEWIRACVATGVVVYEGRYEVSGCVKSAVEGVPKWARLLREVSGCEHTFMLCVMLLHLIVYAYIHVRIHMQASISDPTAPPPQGLFSGCLVYIHGQYPHPYPSKSELIFLLKNGGAEVYTSWRPFFQACLACPLRRVNSRESKKTSKYRVSGISCVHIACIFILMCVCIYRS